MIENKTTTALAKREVFTLQPSTFKEAMQYAEVLADTSFIPQSYRMERRGNQWIQRDRAQIVGDVFASIQFGTEVGLTPMQALQNIAVINGRPSIFGDAVIGLVYASGKAEYIKEWMEGTGDERTAYCETRRRGEKEPHIVSYDVQKAITAGLWKGKDTWKQNPDRMLQMRARGFCLRDKYPDVLKGLILREEADDIPYTPYEFVEDEAPEDVALADRLERRAEVIGEAIEPSERSERSEGVAEEEIAETTVEEKEPEEEIPAEGTAKAILAALESKQLDKDAMNRLCINVFGGQTTIEEALKSTEKAQKLLNTARWVAAELGTDDWRGFVAHVHENQLLLSKKEKVSEAIREYLATV